jgi:arylsulfatase A-like enzyme
LWGIPGLTEDFDTRATAHPLLLKRAGMFEMNPLLQSVLARHIPAWAPLRPQDTTDTLTEYFTAALHNFSGKPLFVWLHYMDPHTPYAPPGAPPAPGLGWPFFFPYQGGEQWGQPVLGDDDFLISPELRPWVEELYRREIQHVDAFIGTVLHQLSSLGVLKNTIICFTSDHGEEFWEHGDWGHGQSLYDEQLLVPLILAGPGIPALRVEQPVSAVSVLPTLSELAHLPTDPGWHGKSLAPLWSNLADTDGAPIFAQGTSNRSLQGPQQMVIDWPFKLIRRPGHEGKELYRLDKDPDETRNLIDEEGEKAIQLNGLLDSWQESFEHTLPVNEEHGETLQQLESMGYL